MPHAHIQQLGESTIASGEPPRCSQINLVEHVIGEAAATANVALD